MLGRLIRTTNKVYYNLKKETKNFKKKSYERDYSKEKYNDKVKIANKDFDKVIENNKVFLNRTIYKNVTNNEELFDDPGVVRGMKTKIVQHTSRATKFETEGDDLVVVSKSRGTTGKTVYESTYDESMNIVKKKEEFQEIGNYENKKIFEAIVPTVYKIDKKGYVKSTENAEKSLKEGKMQDFKDIEKTQSEVNEDTVGVLIGTTIRLTVKKAIELVNKDIEEGENND